MAKTWTPLAADATQTGPTVSTVSVSPTANALLIMVIASMDSGDNNPSSIAGFGTWVLQWSVESVGTNTRRCTCWTLQLGGSPGSETVDVTFTEAQSATVFQLVEVTGSVDTAKVIGTDTDVQTVQDDGTQAQTDTVTLSGLGANSGVTGIACIFASNNADVITAAPGSWAELDENWNNTWLLHISFQYVDSNDTTFDPSWTAAGDRYYVLGAIEIADTADAAGATVFVAPRNPQLNRRHTGRFM